MTQANSAMPGTSAKSGPPVVEAKNLKQVYRIGRGLFRAPDHLQAVGGVSFSVQSGKTLAVVGESGCGKSTLARMVSLIESPTAGELHLNGKDSNDAALRKTLRRSVQLVFQNPYGRSTRASASVPFCRRH